MRRALLCLILLGSLLSLAGCGKRAVPQPQSSADGLGQNLLVRASGDVAYKRPGWNDYSPLTFGIALARGDLLQVPAGGEGLLVCADLSLAALEPGYVGGVPCPDEGQVLTRGDSLVIAPQRGVGTAGPIPILLEPRHTFLRDPHPLIRWTPTASEPLYTVRVWGDGLDWQAQTAASELRYPEEAPPLQAGVTYRVTVTDDSGRSSAEETTALDLGFALLPEEEAAAVDALVHQVKALELEEAGARLVEAEIYAGHALRADAISLLTRLASQADAPAVLQRLGDRYAEIGLFSQARQHYEAALSAYTALGIRAGQAAALTGLGLAQRGDGDEASAAGSLEQARRLCLDLGDAGSAGQIQQILDELASE